MIRTLSTLPGIPALLTALLIAACSPYREGDFDNAVYCTPHFRLYFQERDFTLSEVKGIGERKERLLAGITETLDVHFDDTITTYLYRGYYAGVAYYDGIIHESRDYVLEDNGHEIAHQVCFSRLGTTENGFMTEGMAVMLSIQLEDYNVIEQFASYRNVSDGMYGCDSSWRASEGGVEDQLAYNGFTKTFYGYQQAGAFLEWLRMNHGIGKVKSLYAASQNKDGGELAVSFQKLFGATLTDAVRTFTDRYLSAVPCAVNSPAGAAP